MEFEPNADLKLAAPVRTDRTVGDGVFYLWGNFGNEGRWTDNSPRKIQKPDSTLVVWGPAKKNRLEKKDEFAQNLKNETRT